jgi:hypothetical protein
VDLILVVLYETYKDTQRYKAGRRRATGISQDSGVPLSETEEILPKLCSDGLVARRLSAVDNEKLYKITLPGIRYVKKRFKST